MLFRYFHERAGDIEELLPPEPSSADAVDGFTAIFTRIGKSLNAPSFARPGLPYRNARLVTRWMQGRPIPFLIDDGIRFLKERGQTVSIAAVIRDVLRDIETIARFEAPKYLGCYTGALREFLIQTGSETLLQRLDDLSLFLEFGVSQKTQISLMSLGLSRTATVMLSERITDDKMSVEECFHWLRTNPWRHFDLPTLVKEEIERALTEPNNVQ